MPPELSPETRALRTSVALHRAEARTVLDVRGASALDAVDALVSSDLFVRNGRMLHTFVLDPQGCPEADVLVAVDDEGAFLLVDGLSAAELTSRLDAAASPLAGGSTLRVTDLAPSHAGCSVHGPYAWELMSEVLGDDVLGLPYLAFCRFGELLCFRAGTTGEFGYELLGPPDAIEALIAKIEERLVRFDGALIQGATLDTAALENGFFRPRLLAGSGLDARQQQQQWRLSTRKAYAGRESIERGRAEATPVLVHAETAADGAPSAGQRVLLDGVPFGTVAVSRHSEVLGRSAMRLLVPAALAHPGLDRLVVETASGPIAARTVSSPMLLNRSLYVDPRNHSYHDAETRPEPPLARGGDDRSGQ
jgi:glycine cleavage system aminomethyltransferase T